jgi:hypothetical protein
MTGTLMKWKALFYHRHAHPPSSFTHRTIPAAILHLCTTNQGKRSLCVPARQVSRQDGFAWLVPRPCHAPLQLTGPPFGQLPVAASHPPAACCCPPPAGGRPLYLMICLRWRCGRTLRPIRRVVARRPRSSACLRATRPATWRWWRQGLVLFSPESRAATCLQNLCPATH